jgi:hypothetical protein
MAGTCSTARLAQCVHHASLAMIGAVKAHHSKSLARFAHCALSYPTQGSTTKTTSSSSKTPACKRCCTGSLPTHTNCKSSAVTLQAESAEPCQDTKAYRCCQLLLTTESAVLDTKHTSCEYDTHTSTSTKTSLRLLNLLSFKNQTTATSRL